MNSDLFIWYYCTRFYEIAWFTQIDCNLEIDRTRGF